MNESCEVSGSSHHKSGLIIIVGSLKLEIRTEIKCDINCDKRIQGNKKEYVTLLFRLKHSNFLSVLLIEMHIIIVEKIKSQYFSDIKLFSLQSLSDNQTLAV